MFHIFLALHVVIEQLLWLQIALSCSFNSAKATKSHYNCKEIPTFKYKEESHLVSWTYHALACDRVPKRIHSSLECKDDDKTRSLNHCLSAHEPGHGKSTSMSLQSGVGGREYRKRELDFPWAFTPDKTRTGDKSTNLELLRKFPRFFALRVVLKELLWFRIEFARFPIAAKATKGNYVCVEIPTVKRKQEILLVVESYHTLSK